MLNNKNIAIIGLILLFVGVFLPVLKMPLYGSLSYFQNGSVDGIIFIAIAAIALVLIIKGKYSVLRFPGFGALLYLLFSFWLCMSGRYPIQMKFAVSMTPQATAAAEKLLQKSLQIDWGWGIMIVGAILMIVAGYMVPEKPKQVVTKTKEDKILV